MSNFDSIWRDLKNRGVDSINEEVNESSDVIRYLVNYKDLEDKFRKVTVKAESKSEARKIAKKQLGSALKSINYIVPDFRDDKRRREARRNESPKWKGSHYEQILLKCIAEATGGEYTKFYKDDIGAILYDATADNDKGYDFEAARKRIDKIAKDHGIKYGGDYDLGVDEHPGTAAVIYYLED